MKMGIDLEIDIEGRTEQLFIRQFDDVDAEGTMIAKYVLPLIEHAQADDRRAVDLDGVVIVQPWKIVAIEYTVFDWSNPGAE